jgi:hypothetical protein
VGVNGGVGFHSHRVLASERTLFSDAKRGQTQLDLTPYQQQGLHHSAHAAHAAHVGHAAAGATLFRLVSNEALGGEEQASD